MDETTRGSGQIGVFLLDDHEIVRTGVREVLEAEPDITVVGEAGTAGSALARIPALRPDVAVLDVRLPDDDGVSVCREIRSRMPEVACLMLTSFGDDEALFDAIMAGGTRWGKPQRVIDQVVDRLANPPRIHNRSEARGGIDPAGDIRRLGASPGPLSARGQQCRDVRALARPGRSPRAAGRGRRSSPAVPQARPAD